MSRRDLAPIVLVAALALVPLVITANTVLNVLVVALILALAAQGWNILGGLGGQMSFGHAAFFGTGAYTTAMLQVLAGANAWAGFVAGIGAGAVVGFVVGYLAFRAGLRGSYFALVTLAVAEVLRIVANASPATGGAAGLLLRLDPRASNLQFESRASFYWLALTCVAVGLAVTVAIARSRFGAQLVALRENEDAARALGIDPMRTKLGAVAISSALTAAAGCLYVQYFLYVDANIAFGTWISIEALLAPTIGGVGTILGPVLGAFALQGLGELTKTFAGGAPGLDLVVFGLVLVVVVAVSPRGLMGLMGGLSGGGPDMLEVRHVSRRFGELVALDDVSLAVAAGSITGLIGPNGAGKTTLFAVISGFLAPSAGDVVYLGRDVTGLPPHIRARDGIARTFQIVQPFAGLTVAENVTVGAHLRHARRADANRMAREVASRVGLGPDLDRPAEQLTVAGRKRLELARALATRPKLLLLDEVLAGLNPSEIRDILPVIRAIRDDGTTILMIEHVMQAVMNLCDEVFVLGGGRLIGRGRPQEVTADPAVVEAYLGRGGAARTEAAHA